MAQVLQLYDGTTTVDLLAGNFQVLDGSFDFKTGRGFIWTTIDLGSTAIDDTVRSTQTRIDMLFEKARAWDPDSEEYDQQEESPLWFYWQSEGESAKRALVIDGETEILADKKRSPLLGENQTILRIAIKHLALSETPTDTTASASALSATGGKWNIGSEKGTSAQRIKAFQIDTVTAGIVLQQVWAGIRPEYAGFGSFVSLWEAELGSGTVVVDATASGGNKIQADLTSAPNEGLRGCISIGNVAGSNYHHFVGKYLVLARMKVDAAGTQVAVEMRQYWQGSHSSSGLVYVDGSTAWKLYPLGEISLPPTGNRDSVASGSAAFTDCGFCIFANSFNATGLLDIDCYILIPAEHILTVQGALIDDTPTSLILYTDPDDRQWGLGESTLAQGGLQPSFNSWEYPVEGGLLVIAAQPDSGHNLTATVNLSITLTPRWKTYRYDLVT